MSALEVISLIIELAHKYESLQHNTRGNQKRCRQVFVRGLLLVTKGRAAAPSNRA